MQDVQPWLHTFSDLDRSRSIRAKRTTFSIKSELLQCIWENLTWPRPLWRERSACSFSPDWIDLVWQIYIDLDRSRFDKECNPWLIDWSVQLELLRDRLREKDETLDKKSKQLAGLQMDKKRLETELDEVSDKTSSSDRQIGILNRKVGANFLSVYFTRLFFYLCSAFKEYWVFFYVNLKTSLRSCFTNILLLQ